ncbi:MAG: hypothetical protein US50_C0033G0001, partial [Candidatus Nomurabacteria bacterium GW2011_GWB1_37_5]
MITKTLKNVGKTMQKIREKTTLKWHCELDEKGGVYCSWHKNPFHKHTHWAVFFVILFFASSFIYLAYKKSEASTPQFINFDGKNARGESVGGSIDFIDSDTDEGLGHGRNKNTIPAVTNGKKVKIKFVPDSGIVSSLEFDDVEFEAPQGSTEVSASSLFNKLAISTANITYAAGNANGNNGNGKGNGNSDNSPGNDAVPPNNDNSADSSNDPNDNASGGANDNIPTDSDSDIPDTNSNPNNDPESNSETVPDESVFVPETNADIEIALDEPEIPPGWHNILAIGDVKGFRYSRGRYTKTAEGKDVFKCIEWDYESQACNGRWKRIMKVRPGEEYTVEFAPGDPGYAESSKKVNVLNKKNELLNYNENANPNAQNSNKVDVTVVLEEPVPLLEAKFIASDTDSDTTSTDSITDNTTTSDVTADSSETDDNIVGTESDTEATVESVALLERTAVAVEQALPEPVQISNLVITGLDESAEASDLILTSVGDSLAPQALLVDTSNLTLDNIQITQNAKSNILLSCSDFDETNSSCRRWQKERNVVKGEDFVTTIETPGKSVYGLSRDGIVVLDEKLEVVPSTVKVENNGTIQKVLVQLSGLSPDKIVTYFDTAVSPSGEISLNTIEELNPETQSLTKKVVSFDLSQLEATSADVSGEANGWDLFKCSDFDFSTQTCIGKYKKNKNLVKGSNYIFNVKKEESTQGFFESQKSISLLNAGEELLDYTETETIEDGKSVIEIIPEEGNPIKRIKIRNSITSLGNDLKISPTVVASHQFSQGYAIDPTGSNFETMELELEAKGKFLYKCKEWDFAGNTCLGEWVKIRELSPGLPYTLPIDNQDPGFMEVDEEIPSEPASEPGLPLEENQPLVETFISDPEPEIQSELQTDSSPQVYQSSSPEESSSDNTSNVSL